MTLRAHTSFTFAALAAAALACASPAHAFTCTWTGAASGLANNPANWNCAGSPNPLPANGDDLVFPDNAPNAANYNHNFAPISPILGNVTVGKGYTMAGNSAVMFTGYATVTPPFTGNIPFNGNSTGLLMVGSGTSVNDLALFLSTMNLASVQVGDATGPAHAYLMSSSSSVPVVVQMQGRLGLAASADVKSLSVAPNATLVLSEPPPGANPPMQIGGPRIHSHLQLGIGATLEYRTYANGYSSGFIEMLPGSAVELSNPKLQIVLDDPSQPEPLGTVDRLIRFAADTVNLTGTTFVGLPDGATVQASNAPSVYYRINYGTLAGYEDSVTVTRVAGPLVPPPGPGNGGGATAVPALGPAGLGLMSLLVAGVGVLRRRQRRV